MVVSLDLIVYATKLGVREESLNTLSDYISIQSRIYDTIPYKETSKEGYLKEKTLCYINYLVNNVG